MATDRYLMPVVLLCLCGENKLDCTSSDIDKRPVLPIQTALKGKKNPQLIDAFSMGLKLKGIGILGNK